MSNICSVKENMFENLYIYIYICQEHIFLNPVDMGNQSKMFIHKSSNTKSIYYLLT